jgi:hypothetical protein
LKLDPLELPLMENAISLKSCRRSTKEELGDVVEVPVDEVVEHEVDVPLLVDWVEDELAAEVAADEVDVVPALVVVLELPELEDELIEELVLELPDEELPVVEEGPWPEIATK